MLEESSDLHDEKPSSCRSTDGNSNLGEGSRPTAVERILTMVRGRSILQGELVSLVQRYHTV